MVGRDGCFHFRLIECIRLNEFVCIPLGCESECVCVDIQ